MPTKIQVRRDSAADWTSVDPTLAEGEIGFETDTGQFKIGDGATAWTALDYAQSGATDAADVAVTPAGAIAATDVQAALVELDTEKVAGDGIDSIVALTQAAYDVLDPVVATTLYVIVEA